MNDIVNTLRQRHHNVTGGNPLIEPLVGPTMFSEAADEIERLRTERDEARREVCFLLSRNVTQGCDGDTAEFHATARGWCYLLEEDDE